MKRGKYIVFEGPEGSGKGTHSELFTNWLIERGIETCPVREPGGTQEAEEIRGNLKYLKLGQFEKLMLMQAARRDLLENKVIPNINHGKWVISDRDKLSSLVYQGYAGGLDTNFIESLSEKATMGLNPDLYVLIDVDVETGNKNELEKDQLGGNLDFRRKVKKGYLDYASKNHEKVLLLEYDGSPGGIDRMQSKIKEYTREKFFG